MGTEAAARGKGDLLCSWMNLSLASPFRLKCVFSLPTHHPWSRDLRGSCSSAPRERVQSSSAEEHFH